MNEEGPIGLEYDTVAIDPDAAAGFVRAFLQFFGLIGDSAAEGFTAVEAGSRLMSMLLTWWQVYSVIALLASAVFLYGIIYARLRLNELYALAHQQLADAEAAYLAQQGGKKSHDRVESIGKHASSDNPNDWRLAIIEADIVLEEMLDQRGFRGATIGERLKSASPATFHALDDAWKAHKVRNEIAHKGGDFILTKRIAQETIVRYQHAFDELSQGAHGAGQGGGHH